MKKKIIALAVAGALAAPLAAQAEVTVYGIAHASIDKVDVDGMTPQQAALATALVDATAVEGEDTATYVNSNASRIGVKGSEDLGNGLKAVYGMEWGVSLDGDATDLSQRNRFVGLAGGFGTFLVGKHDTPMKMSTGKLDFFADEVGDYNSLAGFVDHRANNAIAYVSPSFSGLTIAAAIVPGENANNDATNNPNDGLTGATSFAAMYSGGPLYAALGYEAADSNLAVTGQDWTAARAGVGYSMAGFDVAFIYENQDSNDYAGDRGVAELGVKYTMGANAFKAAFAAADAWSEVDDTDHTAFAVGVDHNFSKTSKVYVQYAGLQAGDSGSVVVKNGLAGSAASALSIRGDQSVLSLGMKTKF